jgi:hypothetical protein
VRWGDDGAGMPMLMLRSRYSWEEIEAVCCAVVTLLEVMRSEELAFKARQPPPPLQGGGGGAGAGGGGVVELNPDFVGCAVALL